MYQLHGALEQTKLRHCVVKEIVTDSMEDFILDDMIQKAMRPIWDWAEPFGDDVTFVKEINNEFERDNYTAYGYVCVTVSLNTADPAIIAQYVLERGSDTIGLTAFELS